MPYLKQLLLAGTISIVFFAQLSPSAYDDRNGARQVRKGAKQVMENADNAFEPMTKMWSAPRPILRPPRKPPRRAANGFVSGAAEYLSTNEDPEGDMPRQLDITPDGSTVVIVNRDTDNIVFFDINSRTITKTLGVGDRPVDVKVTPDGAYAVTANAFDDSVSIVDIATQAIAATVPITGTQPYGLAITGDSQYVVVGVINDAVNSTLSVIDLGSFTELRSFGTTPQGVIGGIGFGSEAGVTGDIFSQFALASDDQTLVLPDRSNAQVAIYDITTGAQTALLATDTSPTAVDISNDSSLAVVSHEGFSNRTITIIDLVSGTVSGTVPTGFTISGVVIRLTPDKASAIVSHSSGVNFVDLATGVENRLSTGSARDMEISFDGQYLFATSFDAAVIDIASQTVVQAISQARCEEAVTSPTELRAIALDHDGREDVIVYNINGAAGFVEGLAASGEPDEGDATRTLAFTPDGTKLLAVNNTSYNLSIIDVASATVDAYVPTGARSLGVAVAPDGKHAVVANERSHTVSVIDLSTFTNVANLATFGGPAEVAISPDSQTAFVATMAEQDRIYFIQLDGANSSVLGSIFAGQMGSSSFPFLAASGIGVSPDGSVLAVCDSFNDNLRLIDPITRTDIVQVPVGDFPFRVAFSPDSQRAYVTCVTSDEVYIVAIDNASSHVEAIVPNIDRPLDIVVDASESFVYVASNEFGSPSIKVINANLQTLTATVPLNDQPRSLHLSNATSTLYVATVPQDWLSFPGELVRVSASGAASAVIDATTLSSSPSDLAFHDGTSTAVVAEPVPDGVDIVRFSDRVLPDSFAISTGTLDTGGLPELLDSDDQYLVMDPTFVVARYLLVLTIDAVSPSATPSALQFRLEDHTWNLVGVIDKQIELYNYLTGQFETVDTRQTTSNDSVVAVTPSGDPSRFVEAGTGAMQARITYQNALPYWVFQIVNLYLPFETRVDHAFWTISP